MHKGELTVPFQVNVYNYPLMFAAKDDAATVPTSGASLFWR